MMSLIELNEITSKFDLEACMAIASGNKETIDSTKGEIIAQLASFNNMKSEAVEASDIHNLESAIYKLQITLKDIEGFGMLF